MYSTLILGLVFGLMAFVPFLVNFIEFVIIYLIKPALNYYHEFKKDNVRFRAEIDLYDDNLNDELNIRRTIINSDSEDETKSNNEIESKEDENNEEENVQEESKEDLMEDLNIKNIVEKVNNIKSVTSNYIDESLD